MVYASEKQAKKTNSADIQFAAKHPAYLRWANLQRDSFLVIRQNTASSNPFRGRAHAGIVVDYQPSGAEGGTALASILSSAVSFRSLSHRC